MNSYNVNVGVLGHVDSGKTCLCKSLSTKASTAAFDKNPQSKERGITLDLGFSMFTVPNEPYSQQFTLVDCPGHSSLLKTIICGASIIDICLLVVDVNKGVQAQTAECLILAELACPKLIVVINKIDTISQPRDGPISTMKTKISRILRKTKFKDSPMISVSAFCAIGLEDLISCISSMAEPTPRNMKEDFLMAIDHCFAVKGRGTVLTGTVLSGSRKTGQSVHLPSINADRKIISIQSFGVSVKEIFGGDRAAICLTNLTASSIERDLVCWPSSVIGHSRYFICSILPLTYYKKPLTEKAHLHVAVINQIHPTTLYFFSSSQKEHFSYDVNYDYVEEVTPGEKIFCLMDFGKPTLFYKSAFLIGFNFESGHDLKSRIALSGHVLYGCGDTVDPRLRVLRKKTKSGVAERVCDDNLTVICRHLFKAKSEYMDLFKSFKGTLSTGETGVIEVPFGMTGKVKVRFESLPPSTIDRINSTRRRPKWKKNDEVVDPSELVEFTVEYYKRVFMTDNNFYQI